MIFCMHWIGTKINVIKTKIAFFCHTQKRQDKDDFRVLGKWLQRSLSNLPPTNNREIRTKEYTWKTPKPNKKHKPLENEIY